HGIFSTGRFAGQRVSDHVKTVAFPGLGTGVGQVGANTCAHQVRAAIEQVVLGNTQFPVSWTVAQQQHQLLYTDRVRNLQKE
ncbi:MAG TPA: Appr-1-p processing protein, partial [Acidobacteriota bacterium]|nr:Appr-1-p processing protein [Acidobacteriota bacterium]